MEKTHYAVALGVLASGVILFRARSSPASTRLPPGPKGLPLIGNVADLPTTQAWVKFTELGRKYGGIVYLKALGSSIIILNDAKYALDMLDKKGRKYSDRPTLTMAGDLVGWGEGPALIPFSDSKWSDYRRLFAQFMGSKSKIDSFQSVLQDEARILINNLRADPKKWTKHGRRIVLKIAYGYTVELENDPLVKLVDDAMDQFSETTAPNAFMVDIVPILRFVPQWMPGAGWKRKAAAYRDTLTDMLDAPYIMVKQRMAAGTAKPSFVFNALENTTPDPNTERTIQWAAAGIYSGGADTTAAGLECFILAMTLHVAEQTQAQAELDAVLGFGTLPALSDRSRLPYVEALCTEVLRKYTFGPIGLPHVAADDDEHEGYFIPKGTVIITNVWQFFNDPKTYKDPEVFNPGRFLLNSGNDKETDPRQYLFGFGRRRCPGIHLADASMWLACASILAFLDVRPPLKDGKLILPDARFMDGSISHPAPFECIIRSRAGLPSSI
ncbi:cytochrome P450 [Phlebopus sp. FC_14]|nr:cytochrome P450 [Phlebopus sp. FC_14]